MNKTLKEYAFRTVESMTACIFAAVRILRIDFVVCKDLVSCLLCVSLLGTEYGGFHISYIKGAHNCHQIQTNSDEDDEWNENSIAAWKIREIITQNQIWIALQIRAKLSAI